MEITRIKDEATIISFPILNLNGQSVSGLSNLSTYIMGWDNGSPTTGFSAASTNPTGIGGGDYSQSLASGEMGYDYVEVKITCPDEDVREQRILINNRTIEASVNKFFEQQLPNGYTEGSFGYRMGTVVNVGGAGASSGTIELQDGDSSPIPDAQVWISTDSQGAVIVAGTLYTNALGLVTFWLDSGTTYYIWKYKSGYNFTNPQQAVWP